MRQMACHPDLVLRSKSSAHKFMPEDFGEATVCRLCNEVAEDAIQAKCRHIFDRECIKQYLDVAAGIEVRHSNYDNEYSSSKRVACLSNLPSCSDHRPRSPSAGSGRELENASGYPWTAGPRQMALLLKD